MLFVFVFILTINCYSQNYNIKNLVFEGAGIRGIAYAGVIDELEKNGLLKNIEKVGGTSAGAITALMVSLGYSSKEMEEIAASTKFKKFNDSRFMLGGGLFRMKNLYGWYKGDRFTKWIAEIIENKTGNTEITFEELALKGYKDLYITATCINKQKLIVFSKENYHKMKVKDAVRISISIPLYYKAIFIDSSGTVYKKPDKTKNLDIVLDGGIIGNFPIFIFDSIGTDSANNNYRIPNYQTIGVRIDPELQIQNDSISRELIPVEIQNFIDYVSALYIFIIENLNRNELTDADWTRTISVSSAGIGPRIRKLSKEEKERLINSGRKFTLKYIRNNITSQ
ncbi:MAG: patatin-like phospholipase family protein [Bacteroidia bacterium]|nr:patatin-like phospholipase family protein [Bacteroidia bacterium]